MSEGLPTTRIQLFKCNVKRWDTMLSLSLLVGLLALPLFAVVVASAVIDSEIVRLMQQATDRAEQYAYAVRLLRADSVCALVSVVAFYPFCLGLSGAFNYCKKTAWAEGATLRYDFWNGVRLSLVDAIVPSVFSALTYLFYVSVKWFIVYYFLDVALKIISAVVAALIIALVCSAIMFDLTQSKVYRSGVFQRLKNSVIFALARFPQNLLAVVCSAAPFILLVILPQVWAQLAAFLLYGLYGFGAMTFAQTLYAHSVFDKYVNKELYPEAYRKGLVEK